MLHTRICDLFGITHPIINAPMSGGATAALAAAVSAAGGLGLIGGTTPRGARWLREQIRLVRERTDRPFGVGFISSFPGLDDLVRVALEERVAVVSHSFADPAPYVAPAHAAGVKIVAQVQTVAQAVHAARAGVDAIVAQGTEAGGHTGTRSATLPLVPAVVDAVGAVPVVAAGGIADGRGLAAVLMLGAEGAWLGTRFVASREWAGDARARERVVAAGADDTVLTRVYDLVAEAPFPADIAARVLRNAFTEVWAGRETEVPAQRAQLRTRLAEAQARGDMTVTGVNGGNAAGLIHAVEPAGEIVRRIVAEAERTLHSRPDHVLAR